MHPLTFQVNSQSYTQSLPPGLSLLSVLRQLGWVGVHRACESGDCGACTVLLEGVPIHSCLYPASRLQGHQITTIEGLASEQGLDPMQQQFLQGQGFQCGFCTPGLILSARYLCADALPTETELRSQLRGNLCRCTGYQAILESIQGQSSTVVSSTPDPVGQSIAKLDGPAIVTGKPAYTGDGLPQDVLHLKVLRSPHAHARIRHLSTEAAKSLSGVHAVLTHQDVPRRPYTTAGHAEPVPDPLDHVLLDQKVRFVGDRVAVVVAESLAIAEQACALIQVDYELLPHVLDPLEAMGEGAPIIHDEADAINILDPEHNRVAEVKLESGSVNQGFGDADLILEHVYDLPAVQHTHLEPHVSLSWLEADGTLVVRSSTQVPFHCQRVLSQILDRPLESIRVYKAKIGGGFGNKQEILTEDLCALATLHTGRPVYWELTREEEFTATNSRHAMQIRLKTGAKRDGTLVAQEMEAIANTGAYGNHGQTVVFLTGFIGLGIYRCPHQRFHGQAIYTNTMPAGAFRGYGATQGIFAVETQMDELAAKLQIDPVEIRRRNLIRAGDVLTLGQGGSHFNVIGSYALDQCLEIVARELDTSFSSVEAGSRRRGKGIAVSMQGSGLAKIHAAGVTLSLQLDGTYLLRSGSVDVGTGSDTTLRQIAAQVLRTTVDRLHLLTGDTQQTPFDAGSYASATLYISGQAVRIAAQKLRDQLLVEGARLLQIPPTDLTWEAEGISTSTQQLTLAELAQRMDPEKLTVSETYTADQSTLTFAVQGVEVEVDLETGEVQVLRCVQALDLGTAVNPRICEGQAAGGTAMGIGYALMEELHWDEAGWILNPGFRFYRIPTALDLPSMEIFLVERPDPFGPFGGKGVGEITINGTAPAIANAIANATGVRLRQLPMTPERVWRATQTL
ncbi:MAG: molybdopterin-dependent oxidoreductase [Synechococcaceae cyanobacterium SM2_3_1]|nr:molybdopterin-dependent oxidoreductase [Synechococcaceae cyanobacterium SM2_3_1]